MAEQDTVPVRTGDLRTLQLAVSRARGAIYRDARMHRDDKVYLYSQLKVVDEVAGRYLQLTMFSRAQRG